MQVLQKRSEGTFYNPSGISSCGVAGDSDQLVAAMNAPQYGNFTNGPGDLSPWCGKCIEVSGPKGSITVKITDRCPGCKYGDIDLSEKAFGSIADHAQGRVTISWDEISCSGEIRVEQKGSNSSNKPATELHQNHSGEGNEQSNKVKHNDATLQPVEETSKTTNENTSDKDVEVETTREQQSNASTFQLSLFLFLYLAIN